MADGCIAANKVVVEEIWEEFVKDIVESCRGGLAVDVVEEVHTTQERYILQLDCSSVRVRN